MTPRVVLTLPLCAKRGCLLEISDRHHRGCEAMWLRHFKQRYRTQRYRDFKARYETFRVEDCVEVCRSHHREIHRIYFLIIGAAALKLGPCRRWTWDEAEELMKVLRARCKVWLNEGVSL